MSHRTCPERLTTREENNLFVVFPVGQNQKLGQMNDDFQLRLKYLK